MKSKAEGMTSGRVLMAILVVEGDDGSYVRLDVQDRHLTGCRHCMAMTAMQVSGTFLELITKMDEEENASGTVDTEEATHDHRH